MGVLVPVQAATSRKWAVIKLNWVVVVDQKLMSGMPVSIEYNNQSADCTK